MHDVTHQIVHLTWRHINVHSGLDAPDVEQVVNQIGHLIDPSGDLVHELLLPGAYLADHGDHGDVAAHKSERRAEVVRDRVDEIGFHLIQLFEVGNIAQHSHAPGGLVPLLAHSTNAGIEHPAVWQDQFTGQDAAFVLQRGHEELAGRSRPASQQCLHRLAPGIHKQTEGLLGRGVGQQQIALVIGDNDGVGGAGQDSLQALAAIASGGKEASVLRGHGCLPGQRREKVDLHRLKAARRVEGQPEHAAQATAHRQRQAVQGPQASLPQGQELRPPYASQVVDQQLLLRRDQASSMGIELGQEISPWPLGDGVLHCPAGRKQHDARRTGTGFLQRARQDGQQTIFHFQAAGHRLTDLPQQRELIQSLSEAEPHPLKGSPQPSHFVNPPGFHRCVQPAGGDLPGHLSQLLHRPHEVTGSKKEHHYGNVGQDQQADHQGSRDVHSLA